MNQILVHRDEASLKLTCVGEFHPSELHIKADHWYLKYKLGLLDNSYDFEGCFTGKFWYLDEDNILVFEEYSNKKFGSDSIKHDDDVELRLFLINFLKNATTRFSKLRGGRFEVLNLTEDGRIIYQKVMQDKTIELEVTLDSLEYELL